MICYWKPGTIWNRKERNFRRGKVGRRSCAIRGVALTGLMFFMTRRHITFVKAWKADPDREHLDAYLAAKRMELTEDACGICSAESGKLCRSLELEKRMEQLNGNEEQQPEYRQLRLRGEWRANDRVKYDAENERLITALKNSYRTSVSI